MKLKKILIFSGIIVLVFVLIGATFFGLYIYPFMKEFKKSKTVAYDDKLTLIIGGGGNTGILRSDSLTVVIDTKMDEAGQKLYDTVKQLAGTGKIMVINTHFHSDHVKGNNLYKGNVIVAGGNYSKEAWIKEAGEETLPNQWVKDKLTFKVGDETVTIKNIGKRVHTESDVVVYLHNRKLIFCGDIVLNKQVPALMKSHGASFAGYEETFDDLLKEFDIQTVVPGHGEVEGPEVIALFKQYFKDMKAAAINEEKADSLKEKYKDWKQVPFIMSPSATIDFIKEEKK